jgi:hypothetical protein
MGEVYLMVAIQGLIDTKGVMFGRTKVVAR